MDQAPQFHKYSLMPLMPQLTFKADYYCSSVQCLMMMVRKSQTCAASASMLSSFLVLPPKAN